MRKAGKPPLGEQLRLDDEEVSITLRRAWDLTLRQLSTRVNKPTFETHIRAIRPVDLHEISGDPRRTVEVTLGVPSAFTREWVEKRHSALIAGILEEILDRDVAVKFALAPRLAVVIPSGDPVLVADGPTPKVEIPGEIAPVPATAAPRPPAAKTKPVDPPAARAGGAERGATKARGGSGSGDPPQLNARYTFENFVVGPSNRLAQAGAQAVAQGPGSVYNPLFIYGQPGLGKTHLMHAIGNEILQLRGNGARVAYMSGEQFTSGYITSLREHKAEEFRRRWCSVDVWLVDDIQFIAGKEHTKEEFFHTFNALYQEGKQIVISSDRSPRELHTMDERLRSRFESGLVADIAPPDLETRLAILHRKAEFERMRVPDEVLLYMARLVRTNIRTLEGALVKLIAYASLVNAPITTELAMSILERYYFTAGGDDGADSSGESGAVAAGGIPFGGSRTATSTFAAVAGLGISSAITPELVQRVVAKRFGMTADALSGKRRDREIVVARQIAIHLTRELTEMSMPSIGQRFGGRDHSTVAYSCDKVRSQIPIDDEFRRLLDDLTVQVKSQAPA